MTSPYLKLYRIRHANVWPYECVESVTLVERASPALLTADFKGESTYRFYRRHPNQFVELAPMEDYDDQWEGAGGLEISPYQLIADRPLALQIEYVLYRSWRKADYPKLQELIQRVKQGGVDALDFPDDLRPARAILQGDDESHPWESRRLEGTHPPDRPTSAFIIPEHSGLPYINDHTIPDRIDYEFVQAAVVTYDFYETPPTYDALMKRLDRYCAWFEKRRSDSPPSNPQTPGTKRKSRR